MIDPAVGQSAQSAPAVDGSSRPAVTRTEGSAGLPRVHPLIQTAGAYSWRLIAVALVVLGGLWLVRRLWIVLLAAGIALMLSRVLIVPTTWLRNRGVPRVLSALLALVGFFVALGLIGTLIGAAAADEFDQLGTTVDEAVVEVETWLIDDAPIDITRQQLDDLRNQIDERTTEWFRSRGDSLVSGAVVAFEVLASLLLALITAFFFLKDGPRFQQAALGALPERRRPMARRLAARAWTTLGGYLRGAAVLGVLEGFIIGLTLWITGSSLVVPVMLLTFLGAFVPFVGAIGAALVAVLVALATAGFGAALIVAIVAFVVQQLDNDVLAPVVYGRALELHPLSILFSIAAGSALFGPAGAVLAVPVAAVVLNVLGEYCAVRAADQPTPA